MRKKFKQQRLGNPGEKVQQYQITNDRFLQGRAFNQPPGVGYISAQVRSIADSNDAWGLINAADVPAYITKDDARDAQHAEATVYGGQNPRGGMAAQMQVSGYAEI
jgi:hypothetical protein